MKHFMLPRNPILREAAAHNEHSPNPSSHKMKPSPSPSRRNKSSKENAPPPDPNSITSDLKHFPSPASAKLKSPLPPRPPSSNPLKRKLIMENSPENSLSDSGVKVIVRMRPLKKADEEEGETIVQKMSNNSLAINGQTFTFDSVADTGATQLDMFQLVGAPLVENCLAGFNSSVFAYGQTGSGKTFTMWGPANALSGENLSGDQQGLTPRVFQRLFDRINEEQIKYTDKQLKYQCRCSFLEIYNEQITDLLDPSQRNLQIREDMQTGVYVENLREEYVLTMKDVTQLLIKGLSNRRTGSTSINAESSRSHSVFTCVVESRCKSTADGMSSLKTSRINLVDLAGSERQKLTGTAGERLKEAGNINRSLSQLGNLINILAEISQTGKQRHIPYRDSRLTFLLQESLGGNAKLAMMCAISPAQSCKSETFSTLRFAQRAKAIKNKAIVNEEVEDDVNHLREVIRQLRDELHRVKANSNNPTGWDPRKSLNILKSLIHPRHRLPQVDEDGDEMMEIDEEAVEKLCIQVGLEPAGSADEKYVGEGRSIIEQGTEDTDVDMEEAIPLQAENHEILISSCAKPARNTSESCEEPAGERRFLSSSASKLITEESPNEMVVFGSSCITSGSEKGNSTGISATGEPNSSQNETVNCVSPSSLSVVPSEVSLVLKSPTPSVSPRISSSRKSLRTSSILTASQKDSKDESKPGPENMRISFAKSNSSAARTAQTSKSCLAPTEHLAASLHRGLEIIDSHHKSSVFRRLSFRFPSKPAGSNPILPVDVGVQTFPQDDEISERVFLCTNCKAKTQLEVKDVDDSSNLQLVPIDCSESIEKPKTQVPKAVEKVLAGAIRREMALEEFCAKQGHEIMQLNRLVQQYKHERECNSIIGQTREDKILRLESLMDGVLSTKDFMEEELAALMHEHKLLKDKYENHPEVSKINIEMKRVQDELENYRNFCDLGEREVLLEEIQDLRSQLQYYTDSSSSSVLKRNSLLKLTYPCEPSLAPPPLNTIQESSSSEEQLEIERTRWMDAESKWISLAEELRAELDANRALAEKLKREVDTEKRCAEELKEAMQMAMEGHARMLEQYADLEERHIHLLARHRRIREGIDDVKKAASKAGVRGAESKFINALAAEISALKAEREKERRYFRDESRGLQAQLRDTAEAVQAAGELLARLKEAEEAVVVAEVRAMEAEQDAVKANKQINKLKRKHEEEISSLKELVAGSRLPKEARLIPASSDRDMPKFDAGDPLSEADQRWREAFEPFYKAEDGGGELSKLAEPSTWFSGYDRCNI
ncbi:CENTROMERE PROTEIN E [Salix viminalis]|uniref:CENTROMERE PROTEIN E n=1 Tax=Salix viminalis TaxID=40686 RepID=A0A9Q0UFR3_SALVM|nr:CENTROMERE PROTEIN E [Salix viminalis]KAJ6729145.1 CENTROMERE PROTEIN E [Salix viminalis]